MTVEEAQGDEKRNVLVGIRFDEHTKELLNWSLVKVADPGDRVVAIHVTRNSDSILKDKSSLEGYLNDYQDLCSKLQVDLTGEVVKGTLIRKVLVKEAKKYAAMAVIVGISKRNPLGGLTSIAKYCANNLPITTEVLAIYNGKAVFRRRSNKKLPGFRGDPKPSFYTNPTLKDSKSEFDEYENLENRRHSHDVLLKLIDESKDGHDGDSKDGHDGDAKDEHEGHRERRRRGLTSVSSCLDLSQQRPGWPLIRGRNASNPTPAHGRKLSVVKWVMNLPGRSLTESLRSNNSNASEFSSNKLTNGSGREGSSFSNKSENSIDELPQNLELLLRTNSSGFNLFRHDVLNISTSQFSTENLVAKGASNRVYKGLLPDGKPIAVKISKSSKEAWDNFTMEVNILTSLKHQNITPLLGICVEYNDLITVHDFMSRGNLEQNLHGNNKDKSVLSWELRFNVAVGVAEALNYLHNECSQPVIHRDIKSSNILLSEEYRPQLADFGLAIWGPTTTSFLTQSDVVGTFGYLAPEYFMYGKVSDKMDVYSFGVVLLELLSGKKSIGFETSKGQESLVLWAKPKLESGDLKSIVDPNLDGYFDKAQLERMAIAATLCLTRAARLRPKMNKVLKILRGDKKVQEGTNTQLEDENDLEIQDKNNEEEEDDDDDDEVYPDSCAKSHLGLALLDIDGDSSTSFSSVEQSSNLSLEEFLKGRWSRSSSLD